MNITWKCASVVLGILLSLASARADVDPKAAAKTVAPFLDDQVVAVAHVDFTRVNVDALWATFVDLGQVDLKEVGDAPEGPRGWVADFRAAGGRDVYVIMSFADLVTSPVSVVVPLEKNANGQAIGELFCDPDVRPWRLTVSEQSGNALFCGTEGSLKRLRTTKPHPRPELATAFAAVGDMTVQVAFIPASDMRRVVEEMMPTLPPEAGSGPSTVVTRGGLWAAIGLDLPPNMALKLVIQSSDAVAATALHSMITNLYDAAGRQKDVRRFLPGFASVAAALTPKLEKSRLALSLRGSWKLVHMNWPPGDQWLLCASRGAEKIEPE